MLLNFITAKADIHSGGIESGGVVFLNVYFKTSFFHNIPGVQRCVPRKLRERGFPKHRSVGGFIVFVQSDKPKDIFLAEHEKTYCLTTETKTKFFLLRQCSFGDEGINSS